MYKVVFVGTYGVGKTSIIHRFIHGQFQPHDATIGADFILHAVEVDENEAMGPSNDEDPTSNSESGTKECLLYVWDTAGMEKYRSLLPMYMANAAAVVVVYSVDCERSFEEAARILKKVFRESLEAVADDLCGTGADLTMSDPDDGFDDSDDDFSNEPETSMPVLALVGNKCDAEDSRQVETSRGEELARTFDADPRCPRCVFFETSAFGGENINELFYAVSVACLRKNVMQAQRMGLTRIERIGSTGQGRCCFGS